MVQDNDKFIDGILKMIQDETLTCVRKNTLVWST